MGWLPEEPSLSADANSYVFKNTVQGLWRFSVLNYATKTVTTTYNIKMEDTFVFCNTTSGAFTVTMPLATGNKGKVIIIKRIESSGNAITVARRNTETIDGATSDSIGDLATVSYISDNSNWWIW